MVIMSANLDTDITGQPGYNRLLRQEARRIRQERKEDRKDAPPQPVRRNPAPSTICVITETTARHLEQALCWGWSIEAACDYAEIPVRLYRRMVRNPALRERFETLRQRPENVAKRNISMALEEGDLQTSKWFLERRVADYNPKAQIDVNVHQQVDEASLVDALQRLIAKSQRRELAGGQDVIDDYEDLTQDTGVDDVIEAEVLSPTAQSYLD